MEGTITKAIKYHQYKVNKTETFDVLERYKLDKVVGKGAYGVVCSAQDEVLGMPVAIKKINSTFSHTLDAKRTLTEIKLLRHFSKHENIIGIVDLFPPPEMPEFMDVYVVHELMETDLHQVIRSPQIISEDHVRYFLYQILRGLKYIHSAGVLHRDIKPSNLLLNANGSLKICDFGLAKTQQAKDSGFPEYVVTRWYRAPEILLSCEGYDSLIDMWSVGCVFGELLGRKPLFPGKDFIHTMSLIFRVIGSPSFEDQSMMRIPDAAKNFIASVPRQPKTEFSMLFPQASEASLDLLSKMLEFNPSRRISASEALKHPFFQGLHDPVDEPCCPNFQLDQSSLDSFTKEELRQIMLQEMLHFHPELVC